MHDAAGFLRSGHHSHAVGGGMRHRLFAVDVFSGVHGVNDDLLVPVIGDGGDDTVDFLVVEKLLVAARGGNALADNFLRERVAAVPQIGRGDALDARKLDGIR